MKKRLTFFSVLLFWLSSTLSWAQQPLTVSGTVTDTNNEILIGATVMVKGTTTGISTDIDGKYQLSVQPGATLVFSYVGMQTKEEIVGSNPLINVQLAAGELLEEVVVIGYGTVKKSDLTGAVSSISAKDLQTDIARNASTALQGRVPGVAVTSASGQPGSGMNINIRGITSMNNNTPLYVIDGVYGDINLVDPSDIASLEVLKDASAAAIYGSRAASGVVLITTKTGKRDTPSKVSFNYYAGVQNISKKLDVMDASQWTKFMTDHGQNIPEIPEYTGGKGTNWQDEVYRSAALHKASMNINGGSKTSTYSASVGYTSQDGIVLNSGYEAFNARLKNDFYLWDDRLKIGESIIFKTSNATNQSDPVAFLSPLLMLPTIPVHSEETRGGYYPTPSNAKNISNPVGMFETNTPRNYSTEVLFNAYAELKLYDGLTYKLNFGYNRISGRGRTYIDAYDFGSAGNKEKPELNESTSFSDYWLQEHTLNYNKTFGKHNLSVLAGYSAQENESRAYSYRAINMPAGVGTIDGSSPSDRTLLGGNLNQSTLLSYFGRVMYSFDSRYMLSASIRRDGSSKFADGHRWGTFPSASVGWNIQNEPFAEAIHPVVDELKLRVSYGKLGNQEIDNYMTQSVASTPGMNYMHGSTWWIGQTTGNTWVSPQDLTWEETGTGNVGLDFSFFGGKLSGTMDAFIQKTEDVLLQINMPLSGGATGSPYRNAGTVENKGFEIALNHRNTVGEFTYGVGANLSTVSNKIKEITVGNKQEFDGYSPQGEGVITRAKVGDPIGSFYLIKTNGIFNSQAEIDAHVDANGKKIQPNAQPGDIRFVDYNGDGQITYDDAHKVGSPFPDFSYGLRLDAAWRGFDLNMFFDGTVGNDLFNYPRSRMEAGREVTNFSTSLLKAWTPENHTNFPRYTKDDPNQNSMIYSDRWLEDGSFFRLKTLELGYTLPRMIVEKVKMDRVRVYFAAENLFTITGYDGYTPDLGENLANGTNAGYSALTRGCDHARYPSARILSLGIQIDL